MYPLSLWFGCAICLLLSTLMHAEPLLRVGLGESDQVFKTVNAAPTYEQRLVETLLKQLHRRYQVIKAPHARLRQMLENGELDLAVRQSDQPVAGIYTSAPYISFQDKVFALPDFRGIVFTPADLTKFRITAFQNARHVLGPLYAAAVDKAPQYRELTDHTQSVLMLLKQRTELLVIDTDTLSKILRQLDYQGAPLREFELFAPVSYRIGGHDARLIQDISQLLQQWQQNGHLQQLRNQAASSAVDKPKR